MKGEEKDVPGVNLPDGLDGGERERFEEIVRQRTRLSPYYELLGMRLAGLGRGESRFLMEADGRHLNAGGVVHGGALASLADAAMGVALATLLDPGKERPVTVEMKVNFLCAVRGGALEARGRVVQRGKTLALAEADVFDGEGHLAAKAMGTFAVRPR